MDSDERVLTQLLATYHCDNAYSWDVTSAGVSALSAPSSDAPASVVNFQTLLVPIIPEYISRSRTKSTIGADMLPPRAFQAFTKAQVAKHSGMESDALYIYVIYDKMALALQQIANISLIRLLSGSSCDRQQLYQLGAVPRSGVPDSRHADGLLRLLIVFEGVNTYIRIRIPPQAVPRYL